MAPLGEQDAATKHIALWSSRTKSEQDCGAAAPRSVRFAAALWRQMRRIPAQLDIRSGIGLAFCEAEPAAHLQARLVGDPDFDARAATARGPFIHQSPGDRGPES